MNCLKFNMMKMKYDIFISYRREGGAQYARILQLMLQQRGYRVFLDYDELTDGVFSDHIKTAIKESPIFMLVLSKESMRRCINADDWVRQEIALAIEQQKHIVPINPDKEFDGFPTDMPKELKDVVGAHQHSDISFGQALGVTIDLLIKNRLVPNLGERKVEAHKDEDWDSAMETLRRQDSHNRFMKRLGVFSAVAVIAIVLGFCFHLWKAQRDSAILTNYRTVLHEKYERFHLQLNTDLSMEQLTTIDTLLINMKEVYPDSIWMSQFEFTVGQWYGCLGESYDKDQKNMPMTNVSFADINMRLISLCDMTNVLFELPSVEVWEYSAHGGIHNESTIYSGDNVVEHVAWYQENSGGKPHPSDGQQGKEPNMLDLFDMSGNVSELSNSPFDGSGLYTVCGGNYLSTASEVTVDSRKGFATDAKDKTVGFRIIIRKP
jgi:hypothetical protein